MLDGRGDGFDNTSAELIGTYVAYVTGLAADGTTDDTAVLQAALTAVPAAGGTLFLPAGTILLTDTVYIHSNTRLVGVSQAATTIKRKADTQATSYATASLTGRTSVVACASAPGTGYSSGSPGSNITIEHLTIDGNRQNQTSYPGGFTSSNFFAHGFSARYVDDVNVRFVAVKNSSMSGFYTQGGSRIRISRCNVVNCGDSRLTNMNKNGISISGISSDTVSNHTVEDCYVTGSQDEGVMYGYAANVTITNCHIVSNGLKGIEGDSGSVGAGPGNVIITGNHIDTCGEEGIGIANSDNQKVIVADNRIANTTFSGIQLNQTSESTFIVEGNTIEGVAGGYAGTPTTSYHGMILAGHKLVVTGNEIRDCAGTGISLQKGRLITVADNVIEKCCQVGIQFPASSTDTVKAMRISGNIVALCDAAGIRVTNTGLTMELLAINDNVISEIGKAGAGISPSGIAIDGSGNTIKRVGITGNVVVDERASPEMGNALNLVGLVNAITSLDVSANVLTPGKFRGLDGRNKAVALMTATNAEKSTGGVFRNLFGSAAPVSGDGPFLVGDIAYNNAPASGGILGWVCTVAGTPGTWVPFYVNDDLPWQQSDLITTGQEVFPRVLAAGTSSQSTTNLRLCYFTARKTGTIATVQLASGGTAAGATPTLIRVGIWTADAAGALISLVGSTPNDTALFAVANTSYSKGLSASFTMTQGQRYALGVLVVTAATAPTIVGGTTFINAVDAGLSPRISGTVGGQSDLPASVVSGSITNGNSRPFAVLL